MVNKSNVLVFFQKYCIGRVAYPRAVCQLFNVDELLYLQSLINEHTKKVKIEAKRIFNALKKKPSGGDWLEYPDEHTFIEVRRLVEVEAERIYAQLEFAKKTMDKLELNCLKDPRKYWNKWVYKRKFGLISPMLSTPRAHKVICKNANKLMKKWKNLVAMSYTIGLNITGE